MLEYIILYNKIGRPRAEYMTQIMKDNMNKTKNDLKALSNYSEVWRTATN